MIHKYIYALIILKLTQACPIHSLTDTNSSVHQLALSDESRSRRKVILISRFLSLHLSHFLSRLFQKKSGLHCIIRQIDKIIGERSAGTGVDRKACVVYISFVKFIQSLFWVSRRISGSASSHSCPVCLRCPSWSASGCGARSLDGNGRPSLLKATVADSKSLICESHQ